MGFQRWRVVMQKVCDAHCNTWTRCSKLASRKARGQELPRVYDPSQHGAFQCELGIHRVAKQKPTTAAFAPSNHCM
jgi:hypothetical protein